MQSRASGKWYVWSGKVWLQEERLEIQAALRATACVISPEKLQARVSSNSHVEGAEKEYRILCARPASIFDQHWYYYNTPIGTFNIKTGKIQPHNPLDYLTQISAVSPIEGDCSLYMQWMKMAHEDDQSMIDACEAIGGYSCWGYQKFQLAVIMSGPTNAGKGVQTRLWEAIHGPSYSSPADPGLIMRKDKILHDSFMASLRGIRLAVIDELGDYEELDSANFKRVTGGNTIKTKELWEKAQTQKITSLFIVSTNRKPRIKNVDGAIRRRIYMLLFPRSFAPTERLENLEERLANEHPAICYRMLQWAHKLYLEGLPWPAKVIDAIDDYMSENDLFGQYADEYIKAEPKAELPLKEVINKIGPWLEEKGHKAWAGKSVGMALEIYCAGLRPIPKRIKSHGAIHFYGLRLKYEKELEEYRAERERKEGEAREPNDSFL